MLMGTMLCVLVKRSDRKIIKKVRMGSYEEPLAKKNSEWEPRYEGKEESMGRGLTMRGARNKPAS